MITKENIPELIELLGQAKDFKPIVKMACEILNFYGEDIADLLESVRSWMVKSRIQSILQYQDAGFDREDAIIMTLDDIYGLKKIADKANIKK